MKAAVAVAIFTATLLCASVGAAEMRPERTEKADFTAEETADDKTTAETTQAVKVADFDFMEVEGTNGTEQKEARAGISGSETEAQGSEQTEHAPESREAGTDGAGFNEQTHVAYVPIYSVNGQEMPEDLALMLYEALDRYEIAYFYEVAVWQMYQESNFRPEAEHHNQDGSTDLGVFQFNDHWWQGACDQVFTEPREITDTAAQIEIYCFRAARRLNNGESLEEIISAHYTGGYGYAPEYVAHVMRWQKSYDVARYVEIEADQNRYSLD